MMNAEIITGGPDAISALAAEWVELCREGACNDPFLRPEWFAALAKHFDYKVELVTVRDQGRLRAVLPLVSDKATIHGMPVRSMHALFNLNTPRYGMVHGADESEKQAVIDAMWTVLMQRPSWDVLEMRLAGRGTWINDLILWADSDRFRAGTWAMDGAPFITLDHGGEKDKFKKDYFTGDRKHLGKELDRRLRRLKELGDVEFSVTRQMLPGLLERYLDLETRGWKGRGGTAATFDPRAAALHQEFAAAVAQNDALYAYELKLDGRTIAMSLNIRYDDCVYHWKTSYDEEFAKFSPGNLLFRQLLHDCIDANAAEIDFLSPATPYKKVWATGERDHAAFYVFQPSLIGRLSYAWKFAVISRLRKFKHSHPSLARVLSI
jgi:CelD/BcsL family acetyltransferase involved in cellulose biosynthesis